MIRAIGLVELFWCRTILNQQSLGEQLAVDLLTDNLPTAAILAGLGVFRRGRRTVFVLC